MRFGDGEARRVLIVRLSALGDVIHALPLAENAKAAGARVAWAVERPFAGALEGNPSCDRLIVAESRMWRAHPFAPATWRGLSRLRSEIAEFAPDVVVDAQGLWKSAAVARAAGVPVVGFAADARREPASALLCGIRVHPGPDARHVVDRNLALLPAAGIRVARRSPDASYLLARPRPEAEAFVSRLPKPFAVLHPGAGKPEKAWGEERFAALARGLLAERRWAPVISWGPGDEARAERLASLVPGSTRAPLLDVPGLARLAAAARLFAAGDTGPLHLADALGTPTLALFGPTDARRNGPYRNHNGVIADMRNVTDADVLARAAAL